MRYVRIAILSDIHGNLLALDAVSGIGQAELTSRSDLCQCARGPQRKRSNRQS
jgi:hypothetical protein